ncbi:MAG TPA: YqaJ viral recombinase family protein [Candidatus Limnocylindrales bacterium]|nr:YqaJ viral recombinase family protein [Candidatus Limnocylindrales bacterium]
MTAPTTLRRVAPTAVQVLPHTAPREEWLAARRMGIGASEIAAVMGISPYDSPFSLWWRKHMSWDVEPSDEMRAGTYLEPTIAEWFAEHGDPLENLAIRRAGLYAHPERPWQLATPDRLIHMACVECDGSGIGRDLHMGLYSLPCQHCTDGTAGLVGLLECKWVAYTWDGWGDEDTDMVPVHYRAQVQWQMDVMGVSEVFVCALGPGGFRTYRVRRDERDLVAMREAGRRFMQRLADGEPPDVDDHSATLPILRRINALIEDREQEIPAPIATGWLRAKKFKGLADRVEKRYSAQLRAHLGTAKTATHDGQIIAARTTDDKLMRKS